MDDDTIGQEGALRRSAARARLANLDNHETRFRLLFETIDDGFSVVECLLDENGRVFDWIWLEVNQAFEDLSTLKDVVGRRASELLPSFADNAASLSRALATGATVRSDGDYNPGIDRWFRAHFARVGDPDSRVVAVRFEDITDRKHAEAALRESEERQAFLLKLSDALRPLSDPIAIQEVAARILGEHLDADRTYYAVVKGDYEAAIVEREYLRGDAPSVVGTHPFAAFGSVFDAFRNGRAMVVDDLETTDAIRGEELLGFRALSIRSIINVPLVKGDRSVAGMNVLSVTPRKWTAQQVSLVEETAERTWAAVERARAEAELRESEERFAQFARASSAGLWIRDAQTLAMEFVSPATGTIYGVEINALLGEMQNWAAMIVPEDRDIALEHIAQAQDGASVVHEFRIQRPSDGTFRWVRNTDFPLGGNGHPARIGGIAEDVTKQKLAVEHQSVLLLELQHRVRNIMAIIRSIVARTEEGAGSVAEYASLLSGRLLALARVQALLTRSTSAKVGLAALVHDEMTALAAHAGQFKISGPDVELSPKAAETMTLAIHELATNALKYGALASRDGVVTVRWEVIDKRETPWLTFQWTEAGAPPSPASAGPKRIGFGSELIEGRIPYELRGRGKVTIDPGGARCELEFPLTAGASILETDAPKLAKVFGGAIDMSGQPELSGQHVLVLEDDYYIATDTARALRGAGAEVIGPCATENDAREAITQTVPTCAVVDINLGTGPSFALAGGLKRDGVPFVFITGYDQEVIPDQFASVTRLQKPVQFREIIGALAETVGRAR